TLVQVIDPDRALRVDIFRARGGTLARSAPLGAETGSLEVVAFEDLVARTTAHVYGQLRTGRTIDAKHAHAFVTLSRLAAGPLIESAWQDHRDDLAGSFDQAVEAAHRLLARHPELVTSEVYSRAIVPCDRCRPHGRFRCAPPERVVEILGYW